MRRLALSSPLLVALLVVTGLPLQPLGATHRQQSTPTPVSFPVSPNPSACTVEPRVNGDFIDLLETAPDDSPRQAQMPEPTVVPVPIGVPAELVVRNAISATVHEQYACFNAGDALRGYALVTDDYLRSLVAEQAVTREDISFFLQGRLPVPLAAQTRVLAVTDISVLADGRVGAFIVTDQEFAGTDTTYTVFSRQEGRWLVDETIEFL